MKSFWDLNIFLFLQAGLEDLKYNYVKWKLEYIFRVLKYFFQRNELGTFMLTKLLIIKCRQNHRAESLFW